MNSIKKIVSFLKDFLKQDFTLATYLYTALFLAVCIAINYSIDFENSILDSYYSKPISFLFYPASFAFAYYGVALPVLIMSGKSEILKKKQFWILSASFVTIVGVSIGFYFFNFLAEGAEPYGEYYFTRKLITNLKKIISIGLPLLLVKYIFQSWKVEYGLTLKGFDYKPYLMLLLLMVPLLFAASFTDGFLRQYPMMKPWLAEGAFGLSSLSHIGIYELAYGGNFFFIELMFRGALVLGMYRVMGRHAILPMISIYAFLHFGKPMGETISSIFGGYIIGVIAIYTRSIFGGILIHIGIAWGMDIFSLIQHYLRGQFTL